ncbi:interferon alpha-2-like [Felis catus]|uniref:interferon alpha-2-like n=1 Tax=Felis catus TaxID=9685 RepID=UPI001D1A25ED|nr:interferon alpha-2-like [Felis catus]
MTSRSLPSWALMLLLSSTACSLDCHFQRRGIWEIVQHLENLGKKFPLRCLKDRSNFRFLQVAKIDQLPEETAFPAIGEMLTQVFNTFNLNVSQSLWNESRLERLLSGLYQQTEKTGVCLEQDSGQEDHSSSQREGTRLAIKNYFQGIRDYLQGQKYSHCAWEVIRVEIRRCFLFIEQLTRRHRDQEIGHLHN